MTPASIPNICSAPARRPSPWAQPFPAAPLSAGKPLTLVRGAALSSAAKRMAATEWALALVLSHARRFAAAALVLPLLFVFLAPAAPAQDPKSQLRTVRGVVSEKSSEAPVASAVVFLKNTRNNDVRSYISDPEGNYRFSGLDPNIDYEVHAEKDGAKSATRTVSSFDSKKEIVLNLKLEKKK